MSKDFVITAKNNLDTFDDRVTKGMKKTYEIDFSPWSEDNNTITSVTWVVKSGNVGITDETLTSNVATALLDFTDASGSTIEVTADTGTEIYVVVINIFVNDPTPTNDYGFVN